jgi:hypothetical protein
MEGLFPKFGWVCHFAIFKFFILSLYIVLAIKKLARDLKDLKKEAGKRGLL